MERKSLVRTKPLFPIEYGFYMRDIREKFAKLSAKGAEMDENDIITVYTTLSTLEEFVKFLIEQSDIDYENQKKKILELCDRQETIFKQMDTLKLWFGLINKVVGQMYFDIAEVDKVDFNSRAY